jgi:hypothetical protein
MVKDLSVRQHRPDAIQVSEPSVSVREPYQPRQVRSLGTWRIDDWKLKVYGLKYRGRTPSAATVSAARDFTARTLPRPGRTDTRYGAGFVIVHEGQDARWLLIDWWGHESVLHHLLFMASLDGEPEFIDPPPDLCACVWELPIIAFERTAWVEAVLGATPPGLHAYMEQRLKGQV